MWRLGVLGVLGLVTLARAASWTCSDQTEVQGHETYFVASRCSATGTYTTGGDPMGDGSAPDMGKQLCGSGARHPTGVMVSNTANGKGAETYVATWDQSSMRIHLATAGGTTAPGTPLAQLAAGTTLEGFTIRALAFCR